VHLDLLAVDIREGHGTGILGLEARNRESNRAGIGSGDRRGRDRELQGSLLTRVGVNCERIEWA
jgi:hypothetical protein